MAGMVGDVVVPYGTLTRFASQVFSALGTPQAEAREFAAYVVEADLRGIASHGVVRIPWYVHDIQTGRMRPSLQISTLNDSGALLFMDGHDSLGHLVAARAMRAAIARAAAHGIGAVGVRRSSHFGAAGIYASMAVDADHVGLVLTNGGAVLAPWGGKEKLLGNTPLAIGLPTGEEPAIILDSAQSVVTHGKLLVAKAKGMKRIPSGWALDRYGQPTEDVDEALRGLLVPIGEYKGYGMAFVFDCICGILLGAGVGETIRTEDKAGPGPGHFFCALRVDLFQPVQVFKRKMDERIRQIRNSAKAPRVDRIYLPGEIEEETKARRLREGIPLPRHTAEKLRDLARELRVEQPWDCG